MRLLRVLRALARVELRQLRRHPGRSGLVLLLVAVPVAAVVAGSALARITEPTGEERSVQAMGRAALRVDGVENHADRQRARVMLPSHTQTAEVFLGLEEVRVPGRRLRAKLIAVDLGDAASDTAGSAQLASGMVVLDRGRAPANAGEVALSPVLLDGLERSVGDTVTLAYGVVRTITGVVVDPEDLDAPIVLRTPAHVEHRGVHQLLVGCPGCPHDETTAIATALRDAGFAVTTRAEAAIGAGFLDDVVFVLGTIGFFEAALVIAAAFAVSLRRRQYEIGLLGSTGATMTGIAAAFLVSAATLALLGGMVGVTLGAGAAAAVHPYLDGWNGRANGGFEVSTIHAVGGVFMGVLTAILAAALPARTAARVPIRTALAGRRPATTRSGVWLVIGLSMVAIGLALLLFAPRENVFTGVLAVIVGPILGVLGFGACSPWVLGGLARCATPLPLAWRLAVRDAGRFRARNGPVVTAVLAGMAMSVTVAVFVASLESAVDAFPAPYRDDQLLIAGPAAEDVARRVAAEFPSIATAPLVAVYSHGEPLRARFADDTAIRRGAWVACGGEPLLRALGAEAGIEAFRAGALLAFNAPAGDPELELTAWISARIVATPPVERITLTQHVAEPSFVVDEMTLAARDLAPGPPLNSSLIPWLVRFEHPLTPETLAHARAIAAESVGTTVDAALLHDRPARGFFYLMFVFCGATGLIVIIFATALSAAESAGDERVLRTLGAAPRLLRHHLAARAAYLALLGCVLAVPAGLFPALGLFEAANFPLEFVMPWRDVFVIVLGLPLVAYAGTWLLGGLQRVAIITS